MKSFLPGLTLHYKKYSRSYSELRVFPVPDLPFDPTDPGPTSLSSAVGLLPHCRPKVDPFLQVLLSSCVAFEQPLAFISFQISSLMKAQIKSSREQMGGCQCTLLIRRAASSLTHASVLNHTRNSSSVPQPEPGAQPVLARRESVSFLGAFI